MTNPIPAVVVDASVGIKWLVPEDNDQHARRLLAEQWRLHVPAHFAAEAGGAFVKKARAGELTWEQALAATRRLAELPVVTHELPGLLAVAADLARLHHRSFYDSLYLALALELRVPLVTADRRLYEAVAAPMPSAITWIEDLPAA